MHCWLRNSTAWWLLCWLSLDRLTSSILLVLHKVQMSLNCLNIPIRLTMTMAASTVCKTEHNTKTQWGLRLLNSLNSQISRAVSTFVCSADWVENKSICGSTCDACLPDRKLSSAQHSFTHLREWLEDKTNGHHYQQYHERRHQPRNLNIHTHSKKCVNISFCSSNGFTAPI